MSAVGRYYLQTPSRSLISYESYIITLADMKSVFSGEHYEAGHQYTGAVPTYAGNFILFNNETELGSAIQSLERFLHTTNTWTTDYIPLVDLGKKLYLGVKGGESRIFTYSYIKVTRGFGAGSNFYVLSEVDNLSGALRTALDTYGLVWVARSG